MDWHVVAGLVAGSLMIAGTAPYIRDMLRGKTRPNKVSWAIWALSVGVSTTSQFAAEPSWSLALVATTFVMDVSVFALALWGYGYAKFYWWDGVCLALSILALLLWYITSNPLVALSLAIVADGLAFLPTFIKSYRDPWSETPLAWALFGLSGVAAIGAASLLDFASISFAVYYALANLGLCLLLVLRRHVKKA